MWPSLWLLSCSLVVLAWKLSSFTQKNVPLVNFDGSVYFNHEHLHLPSSKEEILDLVKLAAQYNQKVKVLGSGHSRSAIAQCDGILISLHNFTGLVDFDIQKKQVTVRTGTMLRTVNQYLDEYGLALSNLPAVADQTIGGAISVGTHGTGLNYGNLATMITKLELISGNGEVEVITCSADESPEIFKAAQVSIGMLGVITEVTFQCVDKFNLEETLIPHSLEYCRQNLQKISSSADHVKLWMEPYSGTCASFLVNRTAEQKRDVPNLSLKWRSLEAFIWIASWVPTLTRPIMQLLIGYGSFFQWHNFVDTSFNVLVPQHYFPVNHQAEYIVDYSNCADAVGELMRVVEESEVSVNLISEVRLVKADDIWLSPAYQRDSCHVTLMIYNPSSSNMQHYFDGYYNAIRRFHPRVHWGKYFKMTYIEVAQLYPRLHDFARVRAQLDPKSLFLNDLLENLFMS